MLDIHNPEILHERGWQCPKCGSVYAPFVMECGKCNSHKERVEPELLKALEDLVADIERYAVYPTHSAEMTQARAAIARAKGENND